MECFTAEDHVTIGYKQPMRRVICKFTVMALLSAVYGIFALDCANSDESFSLEEPGPAQALVSGRPVARIE